MTWTDHETLPRRLRSSEGEGRFSSSRLFDWAGRPVTGAPVVSVGIDLVEVERFRALIGRRPRVVERLFTEGERGYASRFRDPAERLAARFAVKEATMKALGVGLGAFRFHDVAVSRRRSGEPELVVAGNAAELARKKGIVAWLVSMTHTKSMAEAVVTGLGG